MPLTRPAFGRRVIALSEASIYHATGLRHSTTNSGPPASGAWPSANLGIAIPFVVDQPTTFDRVIIFNGSTVSGNVDVGIYSADYALIVSSGAVVQASANNLQSINITDTTLQRGAYLLAMSCSSATATNVRSVAGVVHYQHAWGMSHMASAHPLPATWVPAVPSAQYVPTVILTTRASA
jgi:hypothetical protein